MSHIFIHYFSYIPAVIDGCVYGVARFSALFELLILFELLMLSALCVLWSMAEMVTVVSSELMSSKNTTFVAIEVCTGLFCNAEGSSTEKLYFPWSWQVPIMSETVHDKVSFSATKYTRRVLVCFAMSKSRVICTHQSHPFMYSQSMWSKGMTALCPLCLLANKHPFWLVASSAASAPIPRLLPFLLCATYWLIVYGRFTNCYLWLILCYMYCLA